MAPLFGDSKKGNVINKSMDIAEVDQTGFNATAPRLIPQFFFEEEPLNHVT